MPEGCPFGGGLDVDKDWLDNRRDSCAVAAVAVVVEGVADEGDEARFESLSRLSRRSVPLSFAEAPLIFDNVQPAQHCSLVDFTLFPVQKVFIIFAFEEVGSSVYNRAIRLRGPSR